MDTLIQGVLEQMSGNTISNMSSSLGLDEQTTQTAISMALPVIVGALERNASSKEGAESLTNALTKDHHGQLLNDISGNVTRQEVMDDGSAILGHVFGGRTQTIEKSVGKSTGIDPKTSAMLMSMLAPVVLDVLGKKRQEENWGSSDVSRMLQQDRQTAKSQQPQLAQLLDFDGDGDISDEVVSIGSSLLQGFLKNK